MLNLVCYSDISEWCQQMSFLKNLHLTDDTWNVQTVHGLNHHRTIRLFVPLVSTWHTPLKKCYLTQFYIQQAHIIWKITSKWICPRVQAKFTISHNLFSVFTSLQHNLILKYLRKTRSIVFVLLRTKNNRAGELAMLKRNATFMNSILHNFCRIW